MTQARLHPVKVALLAFPVFFLGGLAFSLHGGPCTDACGTSLRVFWPMALGGPLSLGFLSATLPRLAHALATAELDGLLPSRWRERGAHANPRS